MKRSLAESGKASALALAVAAPMCYVLQISMGISLPFWHTLLFAALSLVILEIIGWNRFTAICIPLAIVLLSAYAWWWVFDKDTQQYFIDYYWWAIGFLYESSKYPLGYGIALTAIVSFLVTLLVWLFGRKFFFFPAVFAFVVSFLLFKWLQGLDTVLVPGMIACGGLILLWAKSFLRKTAKKEKKTLPENGIALYLLPLAALIVLISVVAVPREQALKWQNRQVYDMFERINNYIADYTNFNRPRNSFSIGTYGFMPMGNRLGGPTQLSDDEALYVSAPKPMLLRGIIYNSYTGNSWTDTTNSQPKRFSDTSREVIDDTFDRNRPQLTGSAGEGFKRFIEPMTLYLRPVVQSPSTLFVPFRGITSVTSDKWLAILPKFNAKGEVFSAYDIHEGDSYKVTADYLNYESDGFDEMMEGLMALGLEDPNSQATYVNTNYMALPGNIEQGVRDITASIVKDCANDYDKAVAIRDFLMRTCKYTLSPSVPPENMDFVSWFIDHDNNGYCTYYASAMAVMARIAGIPSRYVEGYQMPGKPENNGWYVLRGKNAHAWAELYFKGIGWIPFDATPSGESVISESGGDTGSLFPVPTPTRPGFDQGDMDIGGYTPEDRLTWDDILGMLWLLPAGAAVLLILWAISMMIRAKVRAGVRHVRKKYGDNGRRCAFYYFEALKLLEYYNYPVKKGETPYAYAARIDRWLRLGTGTFMKVADLISRISYSDYEPTDDDVVFMSRFRKELADYTYHTVGARYYLIHQVLGFRMRTARQRQ